MRRFPLYIQVGTLLLASSFFLSAAAGPAAPGILPDDRDVLVSGAVPEQSGAPVVDIVPDGYEGLSRKEIKALALRERTEAELLAAKAAELQRDPVEIWQENRLGLFVNFGLYSLSAGNWNGERLESYGSEMTAAHVFMDEYEALLENFNASDFDAARIVSLAKKSGMGSIVFTAKHHDGFCLFETAQTGFKSTAAPLCQRDFVGELSRICEREGVGFGLWYSLTDWHCPQAGPVSSHNADPVSPEHYRYICAQVTELLQNYGQINEICFGGGSLQPEQSRGLYRLVKSLQPRCLVAGLGNDCGDFILLPDYAWPEMAPAGPWQYADRMYEGTWGYRNWLERDNMEERAASKIRTMTAVLAAGGNYMVDVALNEYGGVMLYESQVVHQIGAAARKLAAVPEKEKTRYGKNIVLDAGNADVAYGWSELDDYLSCRTSLSWNWLLKASGLRTVEFQFASEDIGTFVELVVDGKSFAVELLPEESSQAVPQLEFRRQQAFRLPFRHNACPADLPSYIEEKKPYFLTVSQNEDYQVRTRPMSAVVLERTVQASAAGKVPVGICAGDAVEVLVNGKTVARHINVPSVHGQRDSVETVLMDLHQGTNKVMVKSYSRNGGVMQVAVRPAPDKALYRCTFVLPEKISGSHHQVSLRRLNPLTPCADARLHNLSLIFR